MDPNKVKMFYRIDELEALTGLSRASLHHAARKGQIPSVRIGRHRLIPAEWVRRQTEAAIGDLPAAPSPNSAPLNF